MSLKPALHCVPHVFEVISDGTRDGGLTAHLQIVCVWAQINHCLGVVRRRESVDPLVVGVLLRKLNHDSGVNRAPPNNLVLLEDALEGKGVDLQGNARAHQVLATGNDVHGRKSTLVVVGGPEVDTLVDQQLLTVTLRVVLTPSIGAEETNGS